MSLKLYNSSYKLGEICLQITDGKHGDCENQENSGYYFVSVKDIDDGEINYSNARQITKFDFEDTDRRTKLENEDILITNSGTIGKFVFVNSPLSRKTTFQKSVAIIKPNKNKIIPKFLYYYLISEKRQLVEYARGTTQKNLLLRDIRNFEVKIPDESRQKKIIMILNDIDQLISVNKKLNKNLEEQLLRIFDSWFLKFELSNEFSDSKLGLIPKGWKIDYLGSKKSCSIIKSGIDEFDNSKIYIATADVDNSIITSNDTLITMDDKPSRANMQPISNSIWFAKMIDSKKLIMVDEYCNDLLNNYIFSTGFCGLKCVDKYFYYLWTFLLTDVFDVMKNNFCTGTTMQAINNKDTKLIEFVLPDDKTITQFNSIAKPMFKKIYYNNLEIKKLQRLRDTLLPKLMSGEIDVSKINCDLKIIIRKIYIKSSKLFLWRYLSENQNYIKNTKSNETLLKSRTIYQINKFLAKFNARYRYYRQ